MYSQIQSSLSPAPGLHTFSTLWFITASYRNIDEQTEPMQIFLCKENINRVHVCVVWETDTETVKRELEKKNFIFLLCYRPQFLRPPVLSAIHFHLISLRFALSICSWNQLTVNLFSGISTSPGDLPIDWPFNPVVKILPILTDMKQVQFVCFKVLARVIKKVKFTCLLCWNKDGIQQSVCCVTAGFGAFGIFAKCPPVLNSTHMLYLSAHWEDIVPPLHVNNKSS